MPAKTTANTQLTAAAIMDSIVEAMEARDIRNREARLRRLLAKHEHTLAKTPARCSSREFYGVGYMIVNCHNRVVAGACLRAYDMTLEQAEQFAADLAEEVA